MTGTGRTTTEPVPFRLRPLQQDVRRTTCLCVVHGFIDDHTVSTVCRWMGAVPERNVTRAAFVMVPV